MQAQLELRKNLQDLGGARRARSAEEAQAALIAELRTSLDNVGKLSALMPFCSACH